MKKLLIAVCISTLIITTIVCCLSMVNKSSEAHSVSYDVFINDDGTAQVKLSNINGLIQTHNDFELDGIVYRAGTLIIPGNGDEIYYNYPQKDITMKGDENNEN